MATGMVLFVAGVLLLAGLRIWEKRDNYTVRFTEEVGGLEISAPVRYQGLRVGTVADMQIASDDPRAIEVTISLEPRTRLYGGTTAELARSGLTGLKTINLTPGDPGAARIPPGSQLEAGQSFMGRITGQAEQIARKVEYVANQLASWTSAENRQRFERLIDSLTALANEIDRFLATNREPFKGALGGVEKAGDAIAQLTGEGNRSLKRITKDIGATLAETRRTLEVIRRPVSKIDPDELAGTVRATRQAMTSLDERLSSRELGEAITNLAAALEDLIELIEATDLTVRAGRDDFVAALQDLRQAAEYVREFSRIIAEDPSAVIRGKD
jgi:phospholipid/cholesterol/gamma-HCH transport system substrate-binding protein